MEQELMRNLSEKMKEVLKISTSTHILKLGQTRIKILGLILLWFLIVSFVSCQKKPSSSYRNLLSCFEKSDLEGAYRQAEIVISESPHSKEVQKAAILKCLISASQINAYWELESFYLLPAALEVTSKKKNFMKYGIK